MPSSLLPDFSKRPVSVVIMRLSELLLSDNSQNPLGVGKAMETPPRFACAASALEAAAATRRAAKARRVSMVSPVIGGTIAGRTERLDCAKSMASCGLGADKTETMQGQVGGHVRKHRSDARADHERLIARSEKLRGQPRAFIKLDLHHGVGRLVGERREPRLVHARPRADAPASGRRPPIDFAGKAGGTHRPRRQVRLAA